MKLIGLFFGLVFILAIHTVILYFSWNYVMPSIFRLPELTWLQTLALIGVVNILTRPMLHKNDVGD